MTSACLRDMIQLFGQTDSPVVGDYVCQQCVKYYTNESLKPIPEWI